MRKILSILLILTVLAFPLLAGSGGAWGINISKYPFIDAGYILVGDGTVSLPGVRFASDANNGIYRITTDKWGLSAGGILTAQAYVPQAGDVQLWVDPGATGTSSYPSLAIGSSAANGIYQSSANVLTMRVNSTSYNFLSTQFGPSGDFRPALMNSNSSAILANIRPKQLYNDGLGSSAQNKPSMVANSIEVQQWDGTTAGSEQTFLLRGLNVKRSRAIVTLSTTGATTTVGLTPNAVVMSAAIRVSTQVDGLDAADHHIQLGVAGTTDKYVDVAEGAANAYISVNKKGNFTFNPAYDKETNALILTITGGADQTPTAGAVEVEVIYLAGVDLANP